MTVYLLLTLNNKIFQLDHPYPVFYLQDDPKMKLQQRMIFR